MVRSVTSSDVGQKCSAGIVVITDTRDRRIITFAGR
jgi:hypothetical protein